jgi:hypothetical protein
MARPVLPAHGCSAGGLSASPTPAPPLDPHAFSLLLARDPVRAAAILAAMRPAMRAQQVHAHATLVGLAADQISQTWRELIARFHAPSAPLAPCGGTSGASDGASALCVAVYEPERLALVEPAEARAAVAALTPAQRKDQAVAHAAWLASFGYAVCPTEILAAWGSTPHPGAP